ncbi:hypothetical protein NZ30_19600 [Xanthomonas translucens pv. undulosa]|nr:hypothetical protein NZ30_19600 [Xanthomonas translucens pv. undulosa]
MRWARRSDCLAQRYVRSCAAVQDCACITRSTAALADHGDHAARVPAPAPLPLFVPASLPPIAAAAPARQQRASSSSHSTGFPLP